VKLRKAFALSTRALSRSLLRTSLSVVGVAIGIAGVVMLIGAGAGAEQALRKALEPMGKNLLLVSAAKTETGALRGNSRSSDTLTVADWRTIQAEVPGVLHAVPVVGGQMLSRVGSRTVSTRVTGTTPAFETARSFPIVSGRFIDDGDLQDRSRVAVVGPLVVDELFRGESPLDETIFVRGVPFRVIGVTGSKGFSADGANEDELVIIPFTVAMGRLLNAESLNLIFVQAVSEAALPATESSITSLLRRRHWIERDSAPAGAGADDFIVTDQAATVRAQQAAGRPLSRVVSYASALALGLGGFGLLAVSLLSVRERYSEIGLRLAVGGLPRDILLQFFTEAVLISLLGGLTGLALGALGIQIGTSLTRWPMVLNWQAAAYPLALSILIGIVFGAYPAFRAARLNPIVALNSK
jgi:putative ABC transport system permease protein